MTLPGEDIEQICWVCGAHSTCATMRSVHSHGWPDLDGRPPPDSRYLIRKLIALCPECGFTAHDIGEDPGVPISFVLGEQYQAQRNHEAYPRLANAYLCRSLMERYVSDFSRACRSAVKAAWICDDEEAAAAAVACRKDALAIRERAVETGQPITDGEPGELLLVMDMLRRAGEFDAARQLVSSSLTDVAESSTALTLRFQDFLASNLDQDCYTHEDALSWERLPPMSLVLPAGLQAALKREGERGIDLDRLRGVRAMTALSDIEGFASTQAVPTLTAALKGHFNLKVRLGAASFLAGLSPRDAVPALVNAFQDGVEPWLRHSAAELLIEIGADARPAYPHFLQALREDDDRGIRANAAAVLGAIAPDAEGVEEALVNALLRDKDRRRVRLKAAEALFEIGAHASLARALTQVLEDEGNSFIGSESARLLMRLGQDGAAAVPELTRMFHRSNREGAQIWAAKALVAVAPDDPRVATALADVSHKGRRAAMDALAGVGSLDLAAPALTAVSQGHDDDRFRARGAESGSDR